MKQYKVGDTIYVKGKVKQLDKDGNIYCYQVDIADVGPLWVYNSDMVEKLPVTEPVKSVLPKDVADELEDAKKSAYNFFGFLRDCNNKTYPETCHFMFYDTVSSDTQIKILSDAWYNGYTVEKPKLYNLILGTETDGDTNALVKNNPRTDAVLWLNTNAYADDLKLDKLYQFTQEEIDKYNQDFWIKNIDLNDYKELVADDSED